MTALKQRSGSAFNVIMHDRARAKAFIAAYAAVHGCGPSFALIGDVLRLPGASAARDIVAWLIENRHAERDGRGLRARTPTFADPKSPVLPEVASPRVPHYRARNRVRSLRRQGEAR